MEKKVRPFLEICLLYLLTTALLIGAGVLLSGCVLTPPTPAPVPVKTWEYHPLERQLITSQPGDQELVQLPVGEVRQALLDSEALDAAIPVANTASSELQDMNLKYNEVAKYARNAPLLGALQSALYFLLGGSLGIAIGILVSHT